MGLGHNRLSIIDLSTAGHQPMSNYDSTLWIVFNGEIYNYLELRAELSDYPYRSLTDTEVILAAYERWEKRCVDHFIGMFAFAIWDARRQRLFCARDRLGIKPFHYAWHNVCFLFASEIKAILDAGHPTVPNLPIWAMYLAHGYYDHSVETFFTGVRSLAQGVYLDLLESGCEQELCSQMEEIINSRTFAEWGSFDVQEVQAAYRRFCAGQGEKSFFIWQWANTELWFLRFVDGVSGIG